MLVYWLLFAYFAIGVFLTRADHRDARSEDSRPARNEFSIFLIAGAVAITLLVGLRFEIGGDWAAYEKLFSFARYADLDRMLRRGDPAYQLLNWAAERVGGDIRLVDLVCGAIFSWGLLRFARAQPDTWLAMLIAIPYLVVVVAMGYSRQAVAIGTVIAPALGRGAVVLYSFLVLYVWLNYAAHANYWVPYRFYPW